MTFRERHRKTILPAPKTYDLLQADEIMAGSMPRDGGIPGVYFLIDGTKIVYVGQSTNVHARVYQHRIALEKKFTRYFLLPCQPDELTALESRYIHLYRPKYNLMPVWDRQGLDSIQPEGSIGEIVEGK